MFARIVRVKKKDKTYKYLQIVESYREGAKTKKRVLGNLGQVELLAKDMETLLRSLKRYCETPLVLPSEIRSEGAGVGGPVRVARHLWEQVGLGEKIGRLCGSGQQGFDVAETAFVLVANRLMAPTSEHGLARWLEHTFVTDGEGRRWEPAWLPCEAVTKEQRVRVEDAQLNGWYRTLDALLGGKEALEKELYTTVRDLFSLKVDLVFYDVTSTFFQRREPKLELRRHGHSRDGRPRDVQVVVGVAMANGWPIAHHVWSGNTTDRATWLPMVQDLATRFQIGRVILVGDRGMVNPENLEDTVKRGFRYLVAIPGRRSEEAAQVLGKLQEKAWLAVDENNQVQEVKLDEPQVRYLVVESVERKAYEQSQRERSMKRTRERLAKIVKAVSEGRLKEPAKIGARAARALADDHGTRYYSQEVTPQGEFRFWEDKEKLEAETRREGRYILKTNDGTITPRDAVEAYKELATVEAGFRDLKDVLAMRPVWHRTDDRVRAHIFVATLALFLKRSLQHQLDQARVALSATEALEAMKSATVTELDLNGVKRRIVSGPGPDGHRVLNALGIRMVCPPAPPTAAGAR